MASDSEFEKRLSKVAPELNISTDRVVKYLEEHGYEAALIGSGLSASIIEEEAYLALREEFAADAKESDRIQELREQKAEEKSIRDFSFPSDGDPADRAQGTGNEHSDTGEASTLMANQCVCGSSSVEVAGENRNVRACQACGNSWYLNHCWNCESTIDSRSESVVQCDGCGWYKCGRCGECREDCDYIHEDPASSDTRTRTESKFEKTLFELVRELSIASGEITRYLKEHGYASAIEGSDMGATITSEEAYQALRAEFSDGGASASSRGTDSTGADSSWQGADRQDERFEMKLSEVAEELDISTKRVQQLLRKKGYEDAVSGSGFQSHLTLREAYHALKKEDPESLSRSDSQNTRDARASSSTAVRNNASDEDEKGLAGEWFSDDRARHGGSPAEPDEDGNAFIHIQLTTTGAEQLLQAAGSSGQIPEEAYRKQRQAGSKLQKYALERTATYISRMQDTDRDSNESMVSLRLQREEESIELLLTPKEKCLLLLGVRQRDSRKRVYEEEVEVKLFIDSDGRPPISKGLWNTVEALNTKEDRAEEVERRLRQWTAYLRVQEEEAERRQFHLPYYSVRHLGKPGRLRLRLSQRDQDDDNSRLKQARRDRVSIYKTASAEGRSVARAEVVDYDEQEHCLILDLMDEDAERLQTERLTIPPRGSIEHQARGTLSMIHRQQDAIDTLKETGGAMEKLDRFLFGSDEEINPPPFGPVTPLPASECLDPEHTNEEQRLAVANALECPDMFFLQGPPGTGKTTFIAELCYQLGRRGKRALVASQANLAVDNALSRLQKSRDILAVREAREKKVEEEGQPFVGENAVRTWLKGVAGHAEQRIDRYQKAREARRVVEKHRDLLSTWIEEGEETSSQIDRLESKRKAYKDKISDFQEQKDAHRERASTLRSLTEHLDPDQLLTGEKQHSPDSGSEAERKEAWSKVESSVQTLWRTETEAANSLVDKEDADPWTVCTSLDRLSRDLESGGEYESKVDAAQAAYERHHAFLERVHTVQQHLRDAEARLKEAQQKKEDCEDALQEITSAGQKDRRIDPDDIDSNQFPVWAASARRLSEARALLIGREGRRGDPPERSAKELSRLWSDAEMADRSEDAEHLLKRLKVALTQERERTEWWGIGWLYDFWLSSTLDEFEEAIDKVEDCIQGYSSPLSDHIKREIRTYRMSLSSELEEAEDEVEQSRTEVREAKESLSELEDEAAVITDRLISRFERILPAEEISKGSRLYQFTSTMEALSKAPERLSNLRDQVDQQWKEVRRALRKTRGKLRSLVQEHQEAIEDHERRIKRRQDTVESLIDEMEQIRARHSEARRVWKEVCETDPKRDAQEVEQRPSAKWLDRYLKPLEEGKWKQLQVEKDIVDDWTDAISEGDQTISEGLKSRFFQNANVVGATCARAGKDDFRNQYGIFDVVIVDEVSKATPTELLMPALLGKKVVLVGDHRQLAPVFGHQSNFEAAADNLGMEEEDLQENLRRSLFKERFEYFSEEEDTQEEPDGDAYAGRRTLMLTKQYRMHSQIMRGINQFYNEQLELGHLQENGEEIPLDEVRDHGLDISPWASEDRHLVWVDTPVEGEWEHTQEGPTRYNEKEMETTLSMLQSLADAFREDNRDPLSVGVTSVYAAQVNRLRQKVKQLSLPPGMKDELRISTVDRFQGMERDIMFLNLVLNRQELPPSKWLRTPERINVAMSRARRLLVIVGSKHNYVEVDGTSPAYSRFFNVARKYGHYARANHILDQAHMGGDHSS